MATYELECYSRIPQTTGPPGLFAVDPIDWTGLSYTDELSKPQALNASCKISTLTEPIIQRLPKLHEFATELWLYRDSRLIFAGPLLGWQAQGETLTLQALGLLAYLQVMFVTFDLVFSQIDQHLIVKGLIDHWQNLDYGHFGIDTSMISPSGQLRDATYRRDELHNIAQRVEEVGRRIDGFDIEIDPQSRQLQLWYPQKGVDRSTGDDAIVFDARNVTSSSVVCSAAPGDIATDFFVTGTSEGSTIYATANNADLRARWGRAGATATFDLVTETSTLEAYAQGGLDARAESLLIPGPDVRTVPDADLAAYDVGDTVSYQMHERLGVIGAFRLRKRTVSVSTTGREATSCEFV